MTSTGQASTRRLLYLDAYTLPVGTKPGPATSNIASPASSDSIGYAITSSAAIRNCLPAAGWEVVQPRIAAIEVADPQVHRLHWLLSAYQGALEVLSTTRVDTLFIFHAFSVFPPELRRMILDLRVQVPIVGYTHGSHWDPTDTFRFEAYPGLEIADLANLSVLDCILLVSEQMRETLERSIGEFNPGLARSLASRYRVVGLPLDVDRIEACRTDERDPYPTVVFNHAPVSSKDPEMFVRVMRRVLLPRHDVRVLFTRRFGPDQAGGRVVAQLAEDFPDQVVLGNNLSLPDYYAALWRAELQVSTASHESLGVATLEAMYTQTCCILPRVGAYAEITGNHPAVLYDRGDDQLEERLVYFLDHPEQRRAAASDLQRAAARYRPEVVVGRIADVLDNLLPN
jgi:glycosyltransferase involved in cell wall biosynthesis